MYCIQCGKEMKDDVMFCPYCGKATNDDGVSKESSLVKKTEDKINLANGSKKTLIIAGVAVIVVLLAVILMLVNGGKKNDTSDGGNITSKIVRDSALSEIMGEWRQNGTVWGDAHANLYERPTYIKVEEDGLTGLGAAESFDVETGEKKGENVFYAVSTRKIDITEENGVKYYEFSAEIYTGIPGNGRKDIGIRFHYDETQNMLVSEYNVPEDGFWQTNAKYERIDSIQGDREERLYAHSSDSQSESEAESEQNDNSNNDNFASPFMENIWGIWKSENSDECLLGFDGVDSEGNGLGIYQKNLSEAWDITFTMEGEKLSVNIDGVEVDFYYDLENDIIIRDTDGEIFVRYQ